MDWKYIVPIIGVALGWLLNEVSSHFRVRGAEKRSLGGAIVTILYLRHESVRLTALLDIFKDNYSIKEYEQFRQKAHEKYLLSDDISSESLESAIENVASVSPLLAIRLKRLKEAHIFGKNVKLDHSSESKDKYLQLLSANEAVTDLNIMELEDVIRKLSLKHGLSTYLQVRKMLVNMDEERENMKKVASVLSSK